MLRSCKSNWAWEDEYECWLGRKRSWPTSKLDRLKRNFVLCEIRTRHCIRQTSCNHQKTKYARSLFVICGFRYDSLSSFTYESLVLNLWVTTLGGGIRSCLDKIHLLISSYTAKFSRCYVITSCPQNVILYLLSLLLKYAPFTVAERCKAWTVFARSAAGIVGSNPTQGMDVWCVYSLYVLSCV
jgi:hypothetical protein